MGEYLTEVVVREDSPLVGRTIGEALRDTDFDVDLVQLIRGDRTFTEPLDPKTIQAGDVFAVRTDRDTLVEVVVAPGSSLVGESLATANFRQRMDHVHLRVGDTLLVQGTPGSVKRLGANRDFIVAPRSRWSSPAVSTRPKCTTPSSGTWSSCWRGSSRSVSPASGRCDPGGGHSETLYSVSARPVHAGSWGSLVTFSVWDAVPPVQIWAIPLHIYTFSRVTCQVATAG